VSDTLLVDFWYAHPVGHAVEALRYALGYHRADPTLRISLVLNASTATELASCCPFVERVYPVRYSAFWHATEDPGAALAEVPREWDWVVHDPRSEQAEQLALFRGFAAYAEASRDRFRPRRGRGLAGGPPPEYRPHESLRLELPEEARDGAREALGGRLAVALLPAGSSERSRYPSAGSWAVIVRALADTLPAAAFVLLGKLGRDERTATRMARTELDEIAHAAPSVVDAVDRPLLDQLALVERCGLLVAPHTGFGMAALAVGTPWLALSGGPWHEWFFNGVPFHSVLPDTERYPSFTGDGALPAREDDDGSGWRTPAMTRSRIQEQLPELVDAARRLASGAIAYDDALAYYFPRLLRAHRGDRSRLFSFDAIHERYV